MNKETKKILIYNKHNKSKEIILKNSSYIGKLNPYYLNNKKKQYELFEKNNIVYPFNSNCSGTIWTTKDINHVHNDNIELFIKSLKVLNYIYGGIDFIIPDISKSYKEQRCGILEVNADPSMAIMDSANEISHYNYCKNKYNKIFFDIISLWYNE